MRMPKTRKLIREKKREEVHTLKVIGFATGMVLGMTAATMAVTTMYPSVGKKMKRDGKRIWKNMTSMV